MQHANPDSLANHRHPFSIAGVVALALCAGCGPLKRFGYEGFWRDRWQYPDRVVESLALQPGDRVADIGAGGGYFTFRLARAVGDVGRAYAVDIDRDMTTYLTQRAQQEGVRNLGVILAAPDDPRLPLDGVDLIFTCNTYHHLEDRTAYFANARKYLRPGGRLAIVEYQAKGILQRWFGHSTPKATIRSEIEQAGYQLDRDFDFLPNQTFLVFRAPAA